MSLDLYITLLGGEGLASKDANGLSDPYAKVELRNAQGVLIEGMRKGAAARVVVRAWDRVVC